MSHGNESSSPTVFAICGIPGAGKTTVSGILARRLTRVVHVDGERLRALLVPGAGAPDDEAEDDTRLRLHDQNLAALASNLVEAGFACILDEPVVTRSRLARLLRPIAPAPTILVVLAPPLSVALRRSPEAAAAWAPLDEVMRRDLGGLGLWLDTAELTAEAAAAAILERGRVEGRIDRASLA